MRDLTTLRIYALSECAAVIDLGNAISETLNNKVLAMHAWLKEHPFAGLKDVVPAYSSLTVLYDPFIIYGSLQAGATAFDLVQTKLEEAWAKAGNEGGIDTKTVMIPVCYDTRLGTDLKLMAAAKNLSTDELIRLHCSIGYRVYMLGFLPGFAYMGKLPEKLVMPRKSVPREVEAGSVGIAGWQTGIYPLRSPGGWQIIGRTPIKLFDPNAHPPIKLVAGDTVQFYPISYEEFENYQSAPDAHYN